MKIVKNPEINISPNDPNGWSIYSMPCIMPDDFIFFLLRLINYPEKPTTIHAKQLVKFRFRYPDWESRKKLLLNLVNETGIEIEIADSKCIIKEILISEKAAKNIQRAINNYLKKFVAGSLMPMDHDYFKFEKQKEYFLELIQKKLDAGMPEKFRLEDSEIETGYRLFETTLVLEKEKYLTIENIYNHQNPKDPRYYSIVISVNKRKFRVPEENKPLSNPFCVEENGIGYLKCSKTGKKVKVSRITSRPYRLLHCLMEPFGIAKSVDTAFESLPHAKDVGDNYLKTNKRIEKILFTIKELQKIPEFRDELKIQIDKTRKLVWLERKD